MPKVLGHGLPEHAALFKLNTTVSETKYLKLITFLFIIIIIIIIKLYNTGDYIIEGEK